MATTNKPAQFDQAYDERGSKISALDNLVSRAAATIQEYRHSVIGGGMRQELAAQDVVPPHEHEG